MNKHLGVVVAVLLAGCGVSDVDVTEPTEGADATAEETGELSTRSNSYIVFRRDYRRCISPMCGGYWVRDVNRKTLREEYVSGFDFTPSGLTEETQAKVTDAREGEVVLRGRLGPLETRFNTRTFLVAEAFRGMPGVTVASTDTFYTVEGAPEIRCITAPCPDLRAKRIHSSATTPFHDVDVARAAKVNVDRAWMKDRVTGHGAVVAARFVTRGREQVLDVGQVFMRLPEPFQSCPRVSIQQCAAGYTLSWVRDTNRCLMPAGCVPTVTCPQIRPYCEADYAAMSWNAGTRACARFACDPQWVMN
ncbi:MAG: hypothetical protein MUC96_24155 [Myxococcaceae bacterium]|jgi:hypothetical protein|nr:hypothetical protein [Myxococcaceae bacterium]